MITNNDVPGIHNLKHEKANHHFKLRSGSIYPSPWNRMVYTPTNIAPEKLTSRKKHGIVFQLSFLRSELLNFGRFSLSQLGRDSKLVNKDPAFNKD